MATQADLTAKLTQVADQLDKAMAEIVAALEASDGKISPELEAISERLKAASQKLDDLQADQSTEPTEPA